MEGLIAIWMLPAWTIGVPLLWAMFDLARMPRASVKRQSGVTVGGGRAHSLPPRGATSLVN